jgi:hypothetical protein
MNKRALIGIGALLAVIGLFIANVAGAAQAQVGLGTAGSFAVMGGVGVTNTGPSVINGDLGTCPTPAITGFPPGIVLGTTHAADAVACGAQNDITIAYNDAAGRAPTATYAGPTDLGGMTLVSGVYKSPSTFGLTGTLTLDGQGDPNAVFIFQAASTLITEVNSTVAIINGAQACNVFWQVGSSTTLGVGSTFVGTVLALTSIAANTNAVIQGRLLARNGSTTLDSNTITSVPCAPTPTTVAPTPTTVAPTSTTVAPVTTTVASSATTVAPAPGAAAENVEATIAAPFASAATNATTTTEPAITVTQTFAGPTAPSIVTLGLVTTGTTTTTSLPSPAGDDTARGFARTGAPVEWQTTSAAVAIALGALLAVLSRKRPTAVRLARSKDK